MRTAHLKLFFCSLLTLAATANAQVVISQVYGAGGNSGATLTNDYVELFNRGASSVSLTGMSIQYASATGTGNFGANSSQLVALSGSIASGRYFLVKLASGGANGSALPAADVTGTINMAAGSGKVVLVTGTDSLGCNGGSAACDANALARIVDLVGFGTANFYEGSGAAPSISATTADFRAGAGCTDTDVNSADFATAAPSPRNTSTATSTCGAPGAVTISTASPLPDGTQGALYSKQLGASGGSGSYTWSVVSGLPANGLTLSAAGLVSGTPAAAITVNFTAHVEDSGDPTNFAERAFALTIDPPPASCGSPTAISDIQGPGTLSPLAGQTVSTRGIVTGVKTNGFFLQTPDAQVDADPLTSSGVFVFTNSAPPASVAFGNDVCATGTVQEYIPSTDPNSPSTTELGGSVSVVLYTTGNALPAATTITSAATLVNTLDNLEKYEGMRVSIPVLDAIAPTQGSVSESSATSSSNGVFYGVIPGVSRPFREAGVQLPDPLPTGSPCCVPRFDGNPERIRVDTDGLVGGMKLDVTTGATVTGLTGPLDYAYRTYTVLPDSTSTPQVSGLVTATAVPTPTASEITVGGLNTERFFDTVNDPSVSDVALTQTAFDNRLNKLSLLVRNIMQSPDILGVVEMENLSTLQAVAAKLNSDTVAASQPDPGYQAFLVEGNDIGGIDVGFLVKSARVNVIDVTQYGKDTMYDDPHGGTALLNDRPPLVLRVTVTKNGSATALPLTIIANHLRSLNGIDDPVDGDRVRAKRRAQAEYLANLVQARLTANPGERILLLGDFNAFSVNDGYVDLMGTIKGTPAPVSQVVLASNDLLNPDLTELEDSLPAEGRYSYSFDGAAQSLDHMLVSSLLLPSVNRFAIAHVDADFPEVYRNDPSRPERLSDHDGEVAYLRLPDTLDVTPDCQVTTSPFLVRRRDDASTAGVTVKNNSASPIGGAIYVFIDNLPAGQTVVNAAGTINGSPYILVTAGSLAPGASATGQLQIKVTGSPAITFTTRVVAGSL